MAKKTFTKSKTRSRRTGKKMRRMPNIQQTLSRNIRNMTIPQAAMYAAKGYSLLKGIVNAEKKRFDTNGSPAISSTAAAYHVDLIAQGDDVFNRDGNSILCKYLTLNYTVNMNASATASRVRIVCLVDTQYPGSDPTYTNVFLGNPLTSPLSADLTPRFTILFDDHIDLSINGTRVRTIKHYKPLNFHIKYTGTTGAVGSVSKNSIYFYAVSNEATNTVTFEYDARLVFYDN